MAEYQIDVTKMSKRELFNELTYHGQRVGNHATRLEERVLHTGGAALHRDYRFEWIGEEIRHIAKVHAQLANVAAAEEMEGIRAFIKAEDQIAAVVNAVNAEEENHGA